MYLILLLWAGFSSYAQNIVVSGKVSDTLQNPLAYANILAIPNSDNEEVRFAITDENDKYIKISGYTQSAKKSLVLSILKF